MKLNYKIATALAAGSLLATLLAPAAFADTGISISGNGAGSHNKVKIYNSQNCTVNQSNTSVISNSIGVKSKTGKNNSNSNTNGSTSITTGGTTSTVSVGVSGSTNSADNPCCTCLAPANPDGISITDNGSDSTNKVKVGSHNQTTLTQSNSSVISNSVWVSSNTGGNNANSNTGGDNSITTGDSTTTVGVSVTGSSNTL